MDQQNPNWFLLLHLRFFIIINSSFFRHYSWQIGKWTDDSLRFLFTTTAFTETCTGWIFSCCLMLINSLTVWAQVQVHRRPGHRRGDRAQEAQQLVGNDGGGAGGFVKEPKHHQLAFPPRLLPRQDDWGSHQGSAKKVGWEHPSSCSLSYHPWTPAHDEPRVQECKPFKRWTLTLTDNFQYCFRKGLHEVFYRSREGSDCF